MLTDQWLEKKSNFGLKRYPYFFLNNVDFCFLFTEEVRDHEDLFVSTLS